MNRYEAYKKAKGIMDKGSSIDSEELEYLVLCLSNTNSREYDEVIEYFKGDWGNLLFHMSKKTYL